MFGVPEGIWTLFVWEVSAITFLCWKMGITPMDMWNVEYSKGRDE